MANEGRHMDIVEMDAASHRKIDDIRELIEQTKYAPASARYKIFIIDEVHMLTKEAFNALLKTLEEPPAYIKFILATTDPLKLPATILSRTQHFRFMPISRSDVVKHLEFILSKEGVKFEPSALEILARGGGGSLRDTLTLLDQAIIYSRGEVSAKSVADMLGLLDPEKIEEILNVVESRDKTALVELIKSLASSDAQMVIDELIASLKTKFTEPSPRFALLIFERFFRILSEAKNMLATGADAEFVLYIALFMMVEAFNFTPIDDAIKRAKDSISDVSNLNAPTPISNLNNNSNLSAKKEANISNLNPNSKPAQNPDYARFIAAIYDRSYELGELFDADIEFVSFDGVTMTLTSNAKGKNQETLTKSSKVILTVLRECFGEKAKIAIQKSEKKEVSIADKLLSEAAKIAPAHESVSNLNDSNLNPEPTPISNLNDKNLSEESEDSNLNEEPYDPANDEIPAISVPLPPMGEPDFSSANDEGDDIQMKENINELNSLFGTPTIIQN